MTLVTLLGLLPLCLKALADHNARPSQGWLGAFMAEAQIRGRLEQVEKGLV